MYDDGFKTHTVWRTPAAAAAHVDADGDDFARARHHRERPRAPVVDRRSYVCARACTNDARGGGARARRE